MANPAAPNLSPEIAGDLQVAKGLGYVGISFFDPRTASPDEFGALQQFAW
ncbi:MAG: hypothetical protein H0X24_08615 [Ktedonobacterales bacterium]|nr:hypothetical protein [Ktedonobacterales bacterium]